MSELDPETARRVGALILERAQTAVIVMTTHLTDALTAGAVQTLRVEAGKLTPV